MKISIIPALGALMLGACAPVATPATSATSVDYTAALADPARPAADRERDATRLPGQLLAFAGIEPGQKVGDFVVGGGYLSRVLSAAVGPDGHVYAFQPDEFISFQPRYGQDLRALDDAYANITGLHGPFAAPPFPEPLDAIITVQNFHDLYLDAFPDDAPQRASAALFAALKPGGVLVVVDHSAPAGSGARDASSLHRIDVATVREALIAAGFRADGESALYSRPEDPRTANVFDAAIRGHTDQFALRFRKPI